MLDPDIKLFLNIHPDELGSGGAKSFIDLAEWADRLVLEIAERSKLQLIDSWEKTLDNVEKMGFE